MSRAYIKGGTPVGSESLCRTCVNAHIMTGYRESEMVTVCTNVGPNVVVPPVFTASARVPSTVLLKLILALPVEARVVLAPSVTASP